jgi:hypothetical protein
MVSWIDRFTIPESSFLGGGTRRKFVFRRSANAETLVYRQLAEEFGVQPRQPSARRCRAYLEKHPTSRISKLKRVGKRKPKFDLATIAD